MYSFDLFAFTIFPHFWQSRGPEFLHGKCITAAIRRSSFPLLVRSLHSLLYSCVQRIPVKASPFRTNAKFRRVQDPLWYFPHRVDRPFKRPSSPGSSSDCLREWFRTIPLASRLGKEKIGHRAKAVLQRCCRSEKAENVENSEFFAFYLSVWCLPCG